MSSCKAAWPGQNMIWYGVAGQPGQGTSIGAGGARVSGHHKAQVLRHRALVVGHRHGVSGCVVHEGPELLTLALTLARVAQATPYGCPTSGKALACQGVMSHGTTLPC